MATTIRRGGKEGEKRWAQEEKKEESTGTGGGGKTYNSTPETSFNP